jgi:hypothetical protein
VWNNDAYNINCEGCYLRGIVLRAVEFKQDYPRFLVAGKAFLNRNIHSSITLTVTWFLTVALNCCSSSFEEAYAYSIPKLSPLLI